MKSMIGKKVIVRASLAGVHVGIITGFYPSECTVTISNSRRLWSFYTRDKSGSLSCVAANGLRPDKEHQIGAELKSVTIVEPKGLELDEMTDEAYASVIAYQNK